MKRFRNILAAALAVCALASLPACGGGKGGDPASMDAIETGVTEAMSEWPMTMFVRAKKDSADFENYMAQIGLAPDAAEDLFIARSAVIVNADCIVVLRTADMEKAKEQLAAFHETQYKQWEMYLPDQFQKVKENVTESAGDYLYYVTAGNQQDILAIIEGAL